MAATRLLKILKIKDTFLIKGRGLVLFPAMPLPTKGRFKPFIDNVIVQRPDGGTKKFQARFQLEHFSLEGGASKWSTIVLLPNASKDDVPVGSRLLVSEDVLKSICVGAV